MSYNSLHMPLGIGTWQCQLMPATEFYSPTGGFWHRFGDWTTRSERQREIDDDRQTFARAFRAKCDFRKPLSSATEAICSFLRDQLHIGARDMPTDNAGIERVLRHAVRVEKLVPVINRNWVSYPQTFRPLPAPERWESIGGRPGGGDSFSTTRGKSFHELVMEHMGLDAEGARNYVNKYDAMVDRVNEIDALCALRLKRIEVLAGDDDSFTPFGDAAPIEYSPDIPEGDAFDLAKTPNVGEPGTWYTNPGSGQMRMFGDNGKPVVDFDFDHDHGQGVPHAHNWGLDPLSGERVRGPGLPMSVLP